MKKIILSFILVFTLLMTLVACSGSGGGTASSRPEGTKEPSVVDTLYDRLNDLAEASYSMVELHITTQSGDVELKGAYVLTPDQVTYSVEQLNLLPSEGTLDGGSPSYKITLEGTATIENGKITHFDGDAVELPSHVELSGAFHFQENYFKNVQMKDGEFTAEVVSVSAFLGTNQELSDVKLAVKYNDSAFERIVITYKTENASVTTEYVFEK